MKEDHESDHVSIPNERHRYTPKQGQYLAFIHYFSKINRIPPAEADMQKFFRVSAPTVHTTLIGLEKKGLIEKRAGKPRSVRVLLPPHELPELL